MHYPKGTLAIFSIMCSSDISLSLKKLRNGIKLLGMRLFRHISRNVSAWYTIDNVEISQIGTFLLPVFLSRQVVASNTEILGKLSAKQPFLTSGSCAFHRLNHHRYTTGVVGVVVVTVAPTVVSSRSSRLCFSTLVFLRLSPYSW